MIIPQGYELKTAQQILELFTTLDTNKINFYVKTTSGRILEYELEKLKYKYINFDLKITYNRAFRYYSNEVFLNDWNKIPILIKQDELYN